MGRAPFTFREITMPLWNDKPDPLRPSGDVGALPDSPRRPPPLQPDTTAAPAPRGDESATGGSGDVLIGVGAEFEGKLTFKGTVRIEARFKGSIVTDDVLIVGERAKIDAEISCGTVMVKGEVNGSIRAKNLLELHATARVKGDLETPALWVEKGAVFNGTVKMERLGRGTAAAGRGSR